MTQRAILVLGMHRSGTSALTGLLVRLGAQAPRTPMAANEHNPLGFWESTALYEFHERLLLASGSRWDEWTRLDPSRIDEAGAGTGDELRLLLRQEFGAASLFVVKDPRICRFTSWWLRQLDADGIDPAAILMVRSPLEVAYSLAARDGIGLEQALLLWLRHVLDAEFDTRTVRRSVIRYSDLLLDWPSIASRIATDLGVAWSSKPDRFNADVASFLRPALRHHAIEIEHLDVSPPLFEWVTQAYAALTLLAGSVDQQREALGALDIVRRAFDQASAIFDTASIRLRTAQRERVTRLESEREELGRLALSVDAERDALAAQVEAEKERLSQHVSAIEANGEHLRQEAARVAAERDALAVQMEAQRDRHTRHVATIEADLGHRRQETSSLAADRDALAVQIKAERDRHTRQVAAVEADLEHLRQETSRVTAERDAVAQEREQLRLELVGARRDLGSEIASLSGRLAASDERIQQIQQSRSWRWTAFFRALMRPWLSARSRASR